jgi:hypothetical protein
MQERPPDFYLTTAGEYHPLTEPRACWTSRRLCKTIYARTRNKKRTA